MPQMAHSSDYLCSGWANTLKGLIVVITTTVDYPALLMVSRVDHSVVKGKEVEDTSFPVLQVQVPTRPLPS
jgi:hypothetical protein